MELDKAGEDLMCRIFGVWNLREKLSQKDIELAEKAANLMEKGGPDSKGSALLDNGKLLFIHLRLALVDAENELSNQPFSYENEPFKLLFNGEVYNFIELKKEFGFNTVTESDTEVVYLMLRDFEKIAFDKFRGMFAVAFFDERSKRLVLARDHFGIKPLYYYLNFEQKVIIFSSEIKAIIDYVKSKSYKLTLNFSALDSALKYGYLPSEYTVFNEIFKLNSGTKLEIFENLRINNLIFFDRKKLLFEKKANLKFQEAVEILDSKLNEVIKKRLRTKVNVCSFLSGGIDSSLITAITSKYNKNLVAFSIGYNEKEFDESSLASNIAKNLGVKHEILILTPEKISEQLEKVAFIADDLNFDSSIIPTYNVSLLASKSTKAVVSGDGADELFGGYRRYDRFYLFEKFYYFIPEFVFYILKNFSFKAKKVIKFKNNFYLMFHGNKISVEDSSPLMEKVKKINYLNPDLFTNEKVSLSNFLFFDFYHYLTEDCLVKVDRASMQASLEVRDTFLDYEIVKFAFSLPIEYKYQRGNRKKILKEVLYRYIDKNLFDNKKKGFSIPINDWLDKELKDLYEEQYKSIKKYEFLNKELFDKLKNHKNLRWNIYFLLNWLDTYL